MSQHTPGPWKAHITQDGYSINGVDCLLVTAKRDPVVLPECWEMHKANARLIATAPELLEACKEQHQAIDTLFAMLIECKKDFFPSKTGWIWQACLQGNRAIAKAEGK